MKFTLFISAGLFLMFINLASAQETKGGLVWYSDILKADSISKISNKPIFAFFTGSDWCGWCHKLQNEVFSKQKFIDWAKSNVVLLELDFPRKKQLPQEQMQQNQSLQQALQVSGFPTVWLLTLQKNAETKSFNLSTIGSLGYPRNPVPGKEEDSFLNEANTILKNKK
jgi:thioredoxin-related protein